MPVACHFGSERPAYVFRGQTVCYMMIPGDILIVIVANEFVICHLPVDNKCDQAKKQTEQNIGPYTAKGVLVGVIMNLLFYDPVLL